MQRSEDIEKKEDMAEEVKEEELIDEDSEEGKFVGTGSGRTVTLQMLLSAGILEPGEGTMAIEYLGQRFVGDLLSGGKIKSQETGMEFASPSAWAINCKRIINPEKKSGCGWASIKYRGKKLDVYKNLYFKKKAENNRSKGIKGKRESGTFEADEDMEKLALPVPPAITSAYKTIVKHGSIGNKGPHIDVSTKVECVPFSALGRLQPFNIAIMSSALLMMDFHCHLALNEVVGYLGGYWDVHAHNLVITHAIPLKWREGDDIPLNAAESDVRGALTQNNLTLVGWYHSHPSTYATPSLQDIDRQLGYEIHMKGDSDASYTPCVGMICTPYNKDVQSFESTITCYWVACPPETRPHEYGKPFLMTYNMVPNQLFSYDIFTEMKKTVEYYKKKSDYVKFLDNFRGDVTYLEKMKVSLTPKIPCNSGDVNVWHVIRDMVCPEAPVCQPATEATAAIHSTAETATLIIPTHNSIAAISMPPPVLIHSTSQESSKPGNLSLGSLLQTTSNPTFLIPSTPKATVANNLPSETLVTVQAAPEATISVNTNSGTNMSIYTSVETSLPILSAPVVPERVSLLIPTVPLPAGLRSLSTNTGTSSTSIVVPSSMIGTNLTSELFAAGKYSTPSFMGLSLDPSKGVLSSESLTAGSILIPPLIPSLENLNIFNTSVTSNSNTGSSSAVNLSSLSATDIPSMEKPSPSEQSSQTDGECSLVHE